MKGWSSRLAAAAVPEADLSARHLMAHVLGQRSLAAVRAAALQPLPAAMQRQFDALCGRRLRREPVQYCIGEWDFLDFTLSVRQPVLIPRAETEELVSKAVAATAAADTSPGSRVRFMDVGCGSGAIALGLLRAFPESTALALDVSAAAVALTLENAARLGVQSRLTVVQRSLADFASSCTAPVCDVLVSNPPYLPPAALAALEPDVRNFEDPGALAGGGPDGLDIVRQLLDAAPRLLPPGGSMWLEVDESHPPLVADYLLTKPQAGLALREASSDLQGRPRFLHLVRSAVAAGGCTSASDGR